MLSPPGSKVTSGRQRACKGKIKRKDKHTREETWWSIHYSNDCERGGFDSGGKPEGFR